jgi:glucose/arabinose dehydrogenase
MQIIRQLIAIAFLALFALPAHAQAPIQVAPFVSGLSFPIGLVQDPSDPTVMYVVEQEGLVKTIKSGVVQLVPFINLTQEVIAGGERGLLGLAFAPDYMRSGRFYVYFTRDPDGAIVVSRFKRSATNPLLADKSSRFDLLWPAMPEIHSNCAQPEQRVICHPFQNHNGGKIVFGPDGYLYVGMGDGGAGADPENQAQKPKTLLGKIVRIDVDVADTDQRGYRIPPDNPFAGNDPLGALDEIWSFGVRNPWRLSFDDPVHGGTGALTMGDVGQNTIEEIDYEPPRRGGRNYGWAKWEGNLLVNYQTAMAFEPLTPPIFDYPHSFGITVIGGHVYRGSALGAFYQGRYFYADLVGKVASLGLTIDPATEEATASNPMDYTTDLNWSGSISSLDVDASGEIYVVKYGNPGEIYKVQLENEDPDADGLPTSFETQYGLNAAAPDDPDPDQDGVTNAQELVAGTHPRGLFRSYLAEGAASSFFQTGIALTNVSAQPARVLMRFLGENGQIVSRPVTVAARRRLTIDAGQLRAVTAAAFATIVESDQKIIVERTMKWGDSGYGAHTEKAVEGPATKWFFAEGSQGFFFTYLLLTNPNAVDSHATVRWLIEGAAPVTREYHLEPFRRLTVDAGADPELVNKSFGIEVTLSQPGIAERAMYFGTVPLFNGGHQSAGVTAPATEWLLAEGATGPFFETFVLISNPNPVPALVTIELLLANQAPKTFQRSVPANSRLTLNLEHDAQLPNEAVSTKVTSAVPVVVERAQYWPDPAPSWHEAHNSFGITTIGKKWGLAEGQVGLAGNAQTFILVANPNATPATVQVEFIRETGNGFTKTFTVPGNTRFTIQTGPGTMVPELNEERFAAIITSTVDIAVERALYFDAGGVVWSAGTNATATAVP